MTAVLLRRGEDTKRHREMWRYRLYGGENRDWSDEAVNSGSPRIAGNHQKLEEARKNFFLELSEGVWPCSHFDFGLLASKMVNVLLSL